MLHSIRRSAPLAFVLVLALAAGPLAAALCPAGGHEAHAAMEMPAMAGDVPHGDAMPCHEVPEPTPEPDCARMCCTAASLPAPDPAPVLTASADVPMAQVTLRAEPATVPAPPRATPDPSPPERRRHVELERFLI